MPVVTKEDAARALSGVVGDKRFYCADGCVYDNLTDMADCLEHLSADTFSYHVTSSNNDFANWARDVFNDDKLASDLMRAANAAEAAKIVRNRIHWLQKKSH
jgi:hypothetical protein